MGRDCVAGGCTGWAKAHDQPKQIMGWTPHRNGDIKPQN